MLIDDDLLKRVEDITNTSYDKKKIVNNEFFNYVNLDDFYVMLENLICSYDFLLEKQEDFEQYVRDNFKRKSDSELCGCLHE